MEPMFLKDVERHCGDDKLRARDRNDETRRAIYYALTVCALFRPLGSLAKGAFLQAERVAQICLERLP